MSFNPPTFNITFFLFRPPAVYPGIYTFSQQCQLYLSPKADPDVTPGSPAVWVPPVWLRVPAHVDIRPGDTVEVPNSTGRIYLIRWVEDVHKDFPNEYRVGLLEQTAQPFPLP